ncbi:hypothetical protein OIU85_014591 [Salix viminalis]|uniref:Uncharacterized protein n=1 Tax=Salix viminalis TaxID=40686 RepID=A0A9Q0SAL4_SALVM|nr:hypothetical protein OIU85_014591 [Salix viminalis]
MTNPSKNSTNKWRTPGFGFVVEIGKSASEMQGRRRIWENPLGHRLTSKSSLLLLENGSQYEMLTCHTVNECQVMKGGNEASRGNFTLLFSLLGIFVLLGESRDTNSKQQL